MSEHLREIPASLLDLPRLERYFEKKAGEGLLLARIGGFWSSGNAVLEDIMGDIYHFSVRPFEREQLQRLKTDYEDCGWTLACTRGSLAVFYARAPQRPQVPPVSRERQRELLLGKVRGEEWRLLAALQTLTMAMELLLFYSIFSRLLYTLENAIPFMGYAVMAAAYLLFSYSIYRGRWIRHIQTVRCLKAGGGSPERIFFWNKSAEMSLGLGYVLLPFIYFGWLRGDLKYTIMTVGALLSCAANIAVCAVWQKNTRLHRWKFIPWLLSPAIVLLFLWSLTNIIQF